MIGLASILYGSAMAFTQTNARLVIGYSSVAQLGFITLGIFALAPQGAQGAVLQMVNHGIVVAPLFFIVALLAARAGGSEDIRDMGGIAMRAPVLATIFLIVTFATLAMPGLGQLRRRVPDPARPLQDEDGVLDHRLHRRRDGGRLHAARSSSARCTTAPGRRSTRASCAGATRSCSSRSSRVIGLFALYPQIELSRARADRSPPRSAPPRRGEHAGGSR